MKKLIAVLLSITLFPTVHADTLIHAGRLIDGDSDRAVTERTIRVRDDKIIGVERGYTAPSEDDVVVDRKDATVMPGLMDMHVHLRGQMSRNA